MLNLQFHSIHRFHHWLLAEERGVLLFYGSDNDDTEELLSAYLKYNLISQRVGFITVAVLYVLLINK